MNGWQNSIMLSSSLSRKNMNWYCILTSFLTRNQSKLLQISINPAFEVINQINKYIGVWRSNNDFPKILDSHSMVDVNYHAIISFFVKKLEKALAVRVSSTNSDACYIVWYCTTQVYRLFCMTQPGDEYLLKLHFVVAGTPKLVKVYEKILPDAVNLCFRNWKFPTTPIFFLSFDASLHIHIKYNINSVSIT